MCHFKHEVFNSFLFLDEYISVKIFARKHVYNCRNLCYNFSFTIAYRVPKFVFPSNRNGNISNPGIAPKVGQVGIKIIQTVIMLALFPLFSMNSIFEVTIHIYTLSISINGEMTVTKARQTLIFCCTGKEITWRNIVQRV